jgi:hypothetical protein
MQLRLAFNLKFSCLSLLSAGITGMHRPAQIILVHVSYFPFAYLFFPITYITTHAAGTRQMCADWEFPFLCLTHRSNSMGSSQMT